MYVLTWNVSCQYTAVLREAWATLPESSSRPLPATLAQSRNLAHASLKTAVYEAKDERSFTSLIAMQPLGADHACMPQLKAMYVPFHMAHSGLICSKELQSDRPK